MQTLVKFIVFFVELVLWFVLAVVFFPWHLYRWAHARRLCVRNVKKVFSQIPVKDAKLILRPNGQIELVSLNGEEAELITSGNEVAESHMFYKNKREEYTKGLLISMDLKEQELERIKNKLDMWSKVFYPFTAESVVLFYKEGNIEVKASFRKFWNSAPDRGIQNAMIGFHRFIAARVAK